LLRRGALLSSLALSEPRGDRTTLRRHPTDASSRLRRQSTRVCAYRAGQRVSIVRVPQRLAGIDVGHISLLIGNPDGSLASVGFYAQSYRRGLPLLTRDAGVLVTPDPIYAKALADPALRVQIAELWRGRLSTEQATQLNEWTDDADAGKGPFTLTRFTTSAGEDRELAVARLDGAMYTGIAALVRGAENCATVA